MKISDIPVETGERYELVSITDEVRQVLRDAGVDEGLCIISSTHTTAAVTINEDYDRDVPRDLASACRAFLGALDVRFQHAEGNSDSHLLSSLFGQSQTLLIRDGELDLGRWQGVVWLRPNFR
jgi:secondary thiamine-phosphate synthase enzyme